VADYVTPAELADQLGMRDATSPRLARVCTAASNMIDATIAAPARLDPIPAEIAEVALSLAVDVWKQPDATFAVIGLNETGAVRVPRDLVNRYMETLVRFSSSNAWGIA
jgi:hypothetical protein